MINTCDSTPTFLFANVSLKFPYRLWWKYWTKYRNKFIFCDSAFQMMDIYMLYSIPDLASFFWFLSKHKPCFLFHQLLFGGWTYIVSCRRRKPLTLILLLDQDRWNEILIWVSVEVCDNKAKKNQRHTTNQKPNYVFRYI